MSLTHVIVSGSRDKTIKVKYIDFVWKLTYFLFFQTRHFMLILDVGCPFWRTSLYTAWARQLGAWSEVPSKGKSEIFQI